MPTRNYRKEYDNYQGKPAQKKRRAARNKANRLKGKNGMDVHHKDGNALNNKRSNLSVVSARKNRSYPRTRTAGKKFSRS